MRYFTKELWTKINSQDNAIRQQAEIEWECNCRVYAQQFEATKHRFSSRFLRDYMNRNGLHDYIILGLSAIKRGNVYSCELQLTNGKETVLLTMERLNVMQINVASFNDCMQGKLVWGYSEFEITSPKTLHLAVLCDIQNELIFEFEKISLIKQK